MPDSIVIGHLSAYGKVLSFRHDLLMSGIESGICTAQIRITRLLVMSENNQDCGTSNSVAMEIAASDTIVFDALVSDAIFLLSMSLGVALLGMMSLMEMFM